MASGLRPKRVTNLRHLQRHVALLIVLLGGALHCFAQSGGPPPPAAIEYNERAWKEFSSDAGGFTVLMPGTPTSTVEGVDTALGKIPQVHFTLETGTAAYLVNYADFPVSSDDPARVSRALDAGRDTMLAEQPGTKLLSEKEIVLDGHPGREWVFRDDPNVLIVRAYFVKGRLYNLLIGASYNVAFNSGRPSADPRDRTDLFERISAKFLDSFKLTGGALGEVDRYLAREKVMGKAEGNPPGGVFEAGILQGRVRSLPQPAYPPIAKAARATGSVTVKVVVDEEGKVVAAQAASGHPLLQHAAVEAARQAQFAPTLLGGKPVKVVGTITYNFVGN